MNIQFAKLLGEKIFIDREEKFKNADVVLFHPGHFPELNGHIVRLYEEEPFKKIMIPNVHNKFLNEDEFSYHKKLLMKLGIPENILFPIRGEAESANDVIRNAMSQIDYKTDKNILLAGKTFFMSRFLLIASAYAKDDVVLDVLPLEDNRGLNKENWYLSDGGRKRVINEYHMISQFLNKNSQEIF
ncbi:hypothetical protein ACE38V_08115 [Cytobacillus sp. Hz8]|uniref:hypothetical protein n=1 Tax=Cytobacillus sp. Hz8 TaxID=3347168 RepID=UPI0035D749F4